MAKNNQPLTAAFYLSGSTFSPDYCPTTGTGNDMFIASANGGCVGYA